jgi:UDP-N-acetylmuramoylalanine--D-glutamate ligase
LLEAIQSAAKNAVPGDVILFSPACSSFDQFRNYQHRGEVFRDAVKALAYATGGGGSANDPNKQARSQDKLNVTEN